MSASKYMLLGDQIQLRKLLEESRLRIISTGDDIDPLYANMFIAMLIGRELGLEGIAGMELIDKCADMCKKIKATTQDDIGES